MFLNPPDLPNLSASSLICTASSRVGASTAMVGPTRGSRRVAAQCMNPGSRNPHVLPEPVLAIEIRSDPRRATAHDWAWIGVGAAYPARWISRMISGEKPTESKVCSGSGTCPPRDTTVSSCFLRYSSAEREKPSAGPKACGGASRPVGAGAGPPPAAAPLALAP